MGFCKVLSSVSRSSFISSERSHPSHLAQETTQCPKVCQNSNFPSNSNLYFKTFVGSKAMISYQNESFWAGKFKKIFHFETFLAIVLFCYHFGCNPNQCVWGPISSNLIGLTAKIWPLVILIFQPWPMDVNAWFFNITFHYLMSCDSLLKQSAAPRIP